MSGITALRRSAVSELGMDREMVVEIYRGNGIGEESGVLQGFLQRPM